LTNCRRLLAGDFVIYSLPIRKGLAHQRSGEPQAGLVHP
jgi:hypothetical protein